MRRAGWIALAVVVAVSLAIGARPGTDRRTPAQRVAAIEADLRCPSCEGLSVADSSAPAAVAIRGIVTQQVAAGRSDAQVERFLASRYGDAILLRPPTSGIGAVVWLVPVVAVAGALVGLGGLFWRRRRLAAPGAPSVEDRRLVEDALAGRTVAPDQGGPGATPVTARAPHAGEGPC